ncbi:hypothetical protein [Polymorphobacter megasporae]|uniref:hypothetical protein n=1 Tax=Glacieibacterium megasporae TaxID=2835787 RepID=UPI001C1E80A7|nr:hypothetical protein [Polymorphobacter megasporae]UAJ09087.1 hypothetical protein KTC28_12095 [Polymorphobacter megasporae]
MTSLADYLQRETRLSIAINSVLSLLFYIGFFPPFAAVALAWTGGLGFDFIPQSFAITLMSVLVPGFLTRRRLAAGLIAPLPGRSPLPQMLVLRAILMAAIAAGVGALVGAIVAAVGGAATLPWLAGAAIKIAYGAALAAIVTPIGVRAALHGISPLIPSR